MLLLLALWRLLTRHRVPPPEWPLLMLLPPLRQGRFHLPEAPVLLARLVLWQLWQQSLQPVMQSALRRVLVLALQALP